MLITMRQKGNLTSVGKVLAASGLSFLPDQYNLDDGLVERARQNMQMAYPNLDNVSWLNLATVDVSRRYASEHPVFQAVVQPPATELLAQQMHEEIHRKAQPVYVDASDPKAAEAERQSALEKKAVADADAAAAKVAQVKADAVPGEKIAPSNMHEGVIDGPDLGPGSSTDGLPSAEDLDKVAEEEALKNAPTSNVQ